MAAPTRDLPNAAKSGRFSIGGREVNRLGFGAMRVTGPGIWGEPADRAEAIRTLKRLPELGINFVDTADAYGPNISEELIGETLAPYGDMLVATIGRMAGKGEDATPDYLGGYVIECRPGEALRHGSKRAALALTARLVAGYRAALDRRGFVEIFTPKIVGSATEGGDTASIIASPRSRSQARRTTCAIRRRRSTRN